MTTVYILLLEFGKYYIGKTNNLSARLEEHFSVGGSAWTRKYKPIKIIEEFTNCDSYAEDKYTLQYMSKYGIKNVRGGSFVSINLSNNEVDVINKMLNGSLDNCFKCGKHGHFYKDCKEETKEEMKEKGKEEKKNLRGLQSKKKCERCGRSGHLIEKCYAKTHIIPKKNYTTEIYGCLGDAIISISPDFTPIEYIKEDLYKIQSSNDLYDNDTLTYGPDNDNYMYDFEHFRVRYWFSHNCHVVVTKYKTL